MTAALVVSQLSNGLVGESIAPRVARAADAVLTPDILDLGNVKVNRQKSDSVTVFNTGVQTWTSVVPVFEALDGTPNPPDWSGTNCSTSIVAPGQSCTIIVTVKPVDLGIRLAKLKVQTTPSDTTEVTELRATGTATYEVIQTDDADVCDDATGAPCTLRGAINQANASAGRDAIGFKFTGTLAQTIKPGSALPAATDAVIIDATNTQGAQKIELDGTGLPAGTYGLRIQGGNSIVRGLVVNRFPSVGIALEVNSHNVLEGNYIGVDPTGKIDRGNGTFGVLMNRPFNRIGGSFPWQRNVISGNDSEGILVMSTSDNNVFSNNYIGTDSSGDFAIPNAFVGIELQGPNNTLNQNLISGNGSSSGARGVLIGSTSGNNVLTGNKIGTNATGTVEVPNTGDGIHVHQSANNLIGTANTISGNGSAGVRIEGSDASGNVVRGNSIGTNALGTSAVGNKGPGVIISGGPNNTIGTSSAALPPSDRNFISGNGQNGVHIGPASSGNVVKGNYIGTDAGGNVSFGNGAAEPYGVGVIVADAPNNTISGNTISGNRHGVHILLAASTGNLVQGNNIGLNASGGPLGNQFAGVVVSGNNNKVTDNNIANNTKGVVVLASPNGGTGNSILGNSIRDNSSLGIDLGDDGVTANDAGDADTGPNNLQNFPVIQEVTTDGTNTTVSFTLETTATTNVRLQFFDNTAADTSGFGEGKTLIKDQTFITASNGVVSSQFTVPASAAPPDHFITATATATASPGNTSEFSKATQVNLVVVASFTTVLNTNVAQAGVGGMRGTGTGTISVTGVSGTVTKAYLYWHGPTNSTDPAANASVTFAGSPITGTNIGFSDDNCWNFQNSQAYRADVTSLVTGNGSYALSNFRKVPGGNVVADVNGASLLVFYDDPQSTGASRRDVYVFHGNDSNVANSFDSSGWSATMPNIKYASGSATLHLHVADGQTFTDDDVTLNGTTLVAGDHIFEGDSVPPSPPVTAPGTSASGNLWDIKSFDIASFLTTGKNTLTLTGPAHGTGTQSDCLSLVVAVVSVRAVPASTLALAPATATKAAGQSHTVTATATQDGAAAASKPVTFTVISGPNSGTTGTATTDSSGAASFTYIGGATPGTDTVRATFVDVFTDTITSNTVTVDWQPVNITGNAKCSTTDGVTTTTTVLPHVWLFSGANSELAHADAAAGTGAYTFTGLFAANTKYRILYTQGADKSAPSCGGEITTNPFGGQQVPDFPPRFYRKNGTWLSALTLATPVIITTDVVPPGKSRYYKIPNVRAGTRLDIQALNVSGGDVTLLVAGDIRKKADELNALAAAAGADPSKVLLLTSSQGDIGAEEMGSEEMGSEEMGSEEMGSEEMGSEEMGSEEMGSPDVIAQYSDVYTAALIRSILAGSANPGSQPESVFLNAPVSGDYYIRVTKSSRDTSPFDVSYGVRYTAVTAASCATAPLVRHPGTTAPVTSGVPSGRKTIIFTHTGRLGLTDTAARVDFLDNVLGPLAAHTTVNGFVVDFGGAGGATHSLVRGDTTIAAYYDDWTDANEVSCVEQANLLTEAIKNRMLAWIYAKNGGTLINQIEFTGFAGGDHVIPFRREPDGVAPPLPNERQYNEPLALGAHNAALAAGTFLTDAFYAADDPTYYKGRTVWLERRAHGRIVETVTDITNYTTAYLVYDGRARGEDRAIVISSADWNADMADYMVQQLGGASVAVTTTFGSTALINTGPSPSPGAWTADDATNAWLRQNADGQPVIFGLWTINGHAAASRLRAADNVTRVKAKQIKEIAGTRLQGTVGWSLGCHYGSNTQDRDVIAGETEALSFPEVINGAGGSFAAATGFNYAESILLKNGELVLSYFTREWRFVQDLDGTAYANGEVPAGKALRNAKHLYVSNVNDPDPLQRQALAELRATDVKLLEIMEWWGMPTLLVNVGGTVPGGQRLVRSFAALVDTQPVGIISGLSQHTVSTTYTLNRQPGGATGTTPSYFDAGSPARTETPAAKPIRPRIASRIRANLVLSQQPVPRFVRLHDATFDLIQHTPQVSLYVTEQVPEPNDYGVDVFTPWPVGLNLYTDQALVEIPFMFQGRQGQPGTARTLKTAQSVVYYTTRTDSDILIKPIIFEVAPTQVGTDVQVDITVGDRLGAEIVEVWVSSTSEQTSSGLFGKFSSTQASEVGTPVSNGQGRIRRFQATINPQGDPLAWRGFVTVINSTGAGSRDTRDGQLHRVPAIQATPTAPLKDTILSIDVPAGATTVKHGDVITVSATLKEAATNAAIKGETIHFRMPGAHVTGLTNDFGVATAQLRVNAPPGSYELSASFVETSKYRGPDITPTRSITVAKGDVQFNLTVPASLQYSDNAAIARLVETAENRVLNEHNVVIDFGTTKLGLQTDGKGDVVLATLDFFSATGLAPGTHQGVLRFRETTLFNSKEQPFTVVVTPESAEAVFLSDTQQADLVTLLAQLTQAGPPADGSAGDLTLATLDYSLQREDGTGTPIGSPIVVAGVPVAADGSSTGTVTLTSGLYQVSVDIQGYFDGGLAATSNTSLAVFSPTGKVAAAAQFQVPAGSSGFTPGDRGKFALSGSYVSGAPTGDFILQIPSKKLVFDAVSYDYVVVFGSRAIVQGSATRNGEAGWRFRWIGQDGPTGDSYEVRFWKPTDTAQNTLADPKYKLVIPTTDPSVIKLTN